MMFFDSGTQRRHGSNKYDISGRLANILDTWGPGNLIYRKNVTGEPIVVKIWDGFIFADGDGRYHWAQEIGDADKLSEIDLERPVLIGSSVTSSSTCHNDEGDYRKKSANELAYLGTSPSSWEMSQLQCGLSAGQYAVGEVGDFGTGRLVLQPKTVLLQTQTIASHSTWMTTGVSK